MKFMVKTNNMHWLHHYPEILLVPVFQGILWEQSANFSGHLTLYFLFGTNMLALQLILITHTEFMPWKYRDCAKKSFAV